MVQNKIKEITIHSFMKSYLDAAAAVSDLHRLGFTNDFQLSGNDLLLVQEGLLIRAGEFTIVKYYNIESPHSSVHGQLVFGIIALYHNVKGILINRVKNKRPQSPLLIKKLNELSILSK